MKTSKGKKEVKKDSHAEEGDDECFSANVEDGEKIDYEKVMGKKEERMKIIQNNIKDLFESKAKENDPQKMEKLIAQINKSLHVPQKFVFSKITKLSNNF